MPRKIEPPLPFAEFAPNVIWIIEKTNKHGRWYIAYETLKDAREEVRCAASGVHARLIGQYAWTIDCIAKKEKKK